MAHDPGRVLIFDTTLRDGEQQTGVILSKDDKIRIAEGLAEAGVHRIEAGMPIVSPSDAEAIKEIAKRNLGPQIFAFSRCMKEDVQRAIDAYNEGDYAAAMAVWEPLANQGNRDAQFAMGVLYYEGHGVNKNLDEALAWFRKAADSEHPTAMFNLGVAYWEGRGLSQNYAQAVDWWERAAESGDVAGVRRDLRVD